MFMHAHVLPPFLNTPGVHARTTQPGRRSQIGPRRTTAPAWSSQPHLGRRAAQPLPRLVVATDSTQVLLARALAFRQVH